jgi:hypothetical protein
MRTSKRSKEERRRPGDEEAPRRTPIPDWIPAEDCARLDLSELADLDDDLDQTCRELGNRLGAHVAAYRSGATHARRGSAAYSGMRP